MVNRFLVFLLLCTPLFFPAMSMAQQQELLSAYVDRTEVSINDVFTLTLRVNSDLSNNTPDIDALQQDFIIVGSSQRNNFTFTSGVSEQWTEFRISLRPRNTGTLTIPAFRLGNEVTMPISITVDQAMQNPVNRDDFFLVSAVSKEEVYVQEQLLYTVKIYFSIPFDQGAQLAAPQTTNAVIQQLGNDISSQEIIDGLRYNVIERRFVLFPQSSGTMEISPISFTASVGRRRTGSIFSGQTTGGRAIDLLSDAHTITVKSKPASFPANATWLPSSNLTLEENWSRSLQGITTGEAITRNLRIRADGLSSSLLPELEYTAADSLKFYPDPPGREDLANQNGVTGIRSQGTAIVASEEGDFVLPGIEVPWWNTVTDTLEFARLPEQTLTIIPGSTLGAASNPVLQNNNSLVTNEPLSLVSGGRTDMSYYWILATALFACAWLYSTFMWYRSRELLRGLSGTHNIAIAGSQRNSDTDKKTFPDNDTAGMAFQRFQKACDEKLLTEIRRELLNWARLHFQDERIISLHNLKKYIARESLLSLIDELENSLYGTADERMAFQTENLLKEVKALRQQKFTPEKKVAEHYALPPLYKN